MTAPDSPQERMRRMADEHVRDLTSGRLPPEDVASNIAEDMRRVRAKALETGYNDAIFDAALCAQQEADESLGADAVTAAIPVRIRDRIQRLHRAVDRE